MDPVTVIISALVAGATEALKGTAGQAVKDVYAELKTLIQRRFAGNQTAKDILEEFNQDPEGYKGALQSQLKKADVAQDQEVLDAAKRLKEAITAAGPKVSASGERAAAAGGDMSGVATGDRAVAAGGDISGSTITTGDHNTVGGREKDRPEGV